MTDRYDVVVAGGGPVGMWLAAELRRAEVRVVVLEKRAQRYLAWASREAGPVAEPPLANWLG